MSDSDKYKRAAEFLQKKLSPEDYGWLTALLKDDAEIDFGETAEDENGPIRPPSNISPDLSKPHVSGDSIAAVRRQDSMPYEKRFPDAYRLKGMRSPLVKSFPNAGRLVR